MRLSEAMKAVVERREMPWDCCDEKWIERVEKMEQALIEIGSKVNMPVRALEVRYLLLEIERLVKGAGVEVEEA